MDNNYLPTTEQFEKDKKMRKEWRFLRKREWVRCIPVLGWLIPPSLFLIVSSSYGWFGRDSSALESVLFLSIGIVLVLPLFYCLYESLRNPTGLKYAGCCFACGGPRTESADACRRCGAEFTQQDEHLNAMRHATSRFRRLTVIDRTILIYVGLALLVMFVGLSLVLEFVGPIKEADRADPWRLIVAFVELVVVLFGGLGLVLFVAGRLWKRLEKRLDMLAGSCLACGTTLPEGHEEQAWCGKCGVSFLWQRNDRAYILKKRAARERRKK